MKKVLSVLMALIMAFSTMSLSVFADESGSISATIDDVILNGFVNFDIMRVGTGPVNESTSKGFTITLTGDTFQNISTGADVSDWLTNLPAGLSAKARWYELYYGSILGIDIIGTPTETSTVPIEVTIPASALTTGDMDIVVIPSNSARYNVLLPPAGAATISDGIVNGTVGIPITPIQFNFNFTDDFIIMDYFNESNNDITSWFANLPAGLTAQMSVVGVYNPGFSISGTPTEASSEHITLTVPSEALVGGSVINTPIIITQNPDARYSIVPASSPLAAISDGTVTGSAGTAIDSVDFTISLTNDSFKAMFANEDVSAWFTNLPSGLTANIRNSVTATDTSAVITISATSTTASTEYITLTIPSTALISNTPITATQNPNARYYITAAQSGLALATINDVILLGHPNLPLPSTLPVITINVTGDTFNVTNIENNVTSWFTNLPAGLVASLIMAPTSSTISVAISGIPTTVSTTPVGVTIPASTLTGFAPITVTENLNAKYNIVPISSASAAFESVVVSGVVGTPLTQEVVINLTDTTVENLNEGDNVLSWFTNIPSGLTATVKRVFQQEIAVNISGTPTVTSSANVVVTIPANVLLSNTSLVVTASSNSRYDISIMPGPVTNISTSKSTYSFGEAISISWTAATNAARYELVVKNTNGTTVYSNSNLTGTSANIGTLPTRNYSLTMTAYNSSNVAGPVSSVVYFTVAAPLAGNIASVWPSKSSYTTAENITLNWSTASNAAYYGITVRNTATNAVVYTAPDNLTATGINIGTLPAGSYRFWIAAYNTDNVMGTVSSPADFTVTATAQSNTPQLQTISPYKGATNVFVSAQIRLTFDRNISGNYGGVKIRHYNSGAEVPGSFMNHGNGATFTPSNLLLPNTKYYVEIQNGALYDSSNSANVFPGITNKDTWSFTTSVTASHPQTQAYVKQMQVNIGEGKYLDVRDGIGVSSNIKANFVHGLEVTTLLRTVQQIDGYYWVQITYYGITGWVPEIYLSEIIVAPTQLDIRWPIIDYNIPYSGDGGGSGFMPNRDLRHLIGRLDGHLALDLTSKSNNLSIYPFLNGTVEFAGWENTNGNYIVIKHVNADNKPFYSWYVHLESMNVKKGDTVNTNTLIGQMGGTGTGGGGRIHLHFMITSTILNQAIPGLSNYPIDWDYTGNVPTKGGTLDYVEYNGTRYFNPYLIIQNKSLSTIKIP